MQVSSLSSPLTPLSYLDLIDAVEARLTAPSASFVLVYRNPIHICFIDGKTSASLVLFNKVKVAVMLIAQLIFSAAAPCQAGAISATVRVLDSLPGTVVQYYYECYSYSRDKQSGSSIPAHPPTIFRM